MFEISNVKVPGGALLSFKCETIEQLFEQANFLQSMPQVCPLDGSETIFSYRVDDENNSYYAVISLTNPQYSYKYGKRKGTQQLFPKGWFEYDLASRQSWRWYNGRWYEHDEDGKPILNKPRPSADRVTNPALAVLDNELAAILPTKDVVVRRESNQEDVRFQAAQKIFDDLGLSLYAAQWTQVARHNTERVTSGKETDWRKLTLEQLNKLTKGMRDLQGKRQPA